MDGSIYLAMAGANQVALAQATNANNLANVSTTGFRADLDAFRSLPVHGDVLPTRVYSSDEKTGVDFAQGSLLRTGRALDVAVSGDGFIAVQAADGSEGFTRAGDLRVDAQGLLTTGTGRPVLGNGGPVAIPPFERLQIGSDGTISIQPLGQESSALATVDRIKLVKPAAESLEKREDGLLGLPEGAQAEADAGVQLVSGAIESSNVNAVESMVRMIELARMFEMNVKLMQAAKENDAASSQLLSLG